MAAPSPLDLDQATMQRLGHRVADLVARHLATLRDQPVLTVLDGATAARTIGGPPPEQGTDFDDLVRTLEEKVLPFHAREPHPGFVAYVPSCPTYPAILGDWIATGYNFFAGVWPVASGPNQIEVTVLDWFRDWLGMPAGTGGLLTSGGSAATLNAVIAARHACAGDDVSRFPRLVLYASDQAHFSVAKAAWIAGVPREQVRTISTDPQRRMRPDLLAEAILRDRAAGLLPFLVAASAGTTNTGAVDPLLPLADLCADSGLWLHVDAAFGGFSALTGRGRALLHGIERADSVTLDPHKWLFVPFECGCLLARDPDRLRAAFRFQAEYMKDVENDGREVNFADYGEQLTRYSRAMKIWFSVKYFGTTAIRQAIQGGIELAEYAEERVRATQGLEVLSPAQLGVLCFRAHPAGLDDLAGLNALNQKINHDITAAGRFFIASTRLDGAYSLRVCLHGFRTTPEDVDELIQQVASFTPSPHSPRYHPRPSPSP